MTDFDCRRFQQWLDAGGALAPGAPDDAARRHAAACPACAAALAAEHAVVRLFAGAARGPGPDPAPDFADRVLAAVAVTPQDRLPRVATPERSLPRLADPLPWWVRAAAQPASALGLGVAGLAVLVAPQLVDGARLAPAWTSTTVAALGGVLAPGLAGALALAFLPLVGVATPALYRLGLRAAALRPAGPTSPPLARSAGA